MKKLLFASFILLAGCKTISPTQQALLVDAETLANIAGTAVATYYGGPAAGQLASAGLSALGQVAQGYIGRTMPLAVIEATPGVEKLGQVAASVINLKAPIRQQDVTTFDNAAALLTGK